MARVVKDSKFTECVFEKAVWRLKDRAVLVAVNRAAECRVAGGDAIVDDGVGAYLADRVLQFDVEIVEAHREVRYEVRRKHDTRGIGVGFFRLQIRIAAQQTEILAVVVGANVPVLRRAHAGKRALGLGRRGSRTRAGIRVAVEGHGFRGKKFGDVWRRTPAAINVTD